MQVSQLPEIVQTDLTNFLDENPSRWASYQTQEAFLAQCEPQEIVDMCLEWNGISGYTNQIVTLVLSAFAAQGEQRIRR